MIANKYAILEKLSEGSFGTIVKGKNVRTHEFVAIKMELKTAEQNSLKNEARVYNYLGKQNGFPQLKWFGTNEKYNYLVINLLGSSLTQCIKKYTRLSLKTTIKMGIQIIVLIRCLHDKLMVHRDIKPDNFLFGLDKYTNKLHLIDLGFCKRYDYDGKHMAETRINTLVGTANFVSLNVHKGLEPSRRDDVESCIYVMLYMITGKLEWLNGTTNRHIFELKRDIVYKDKDKDYVPAFIKSLLTYIRELKFDERPNYDHIINILDLEYTINLFVDDDKYEWNS
jgi:serine/threonine protein kinase